jgi:tetratricopeptide (TPR) repeat protein
MLDLASSSSSSLTSQPTPAGEKTPAGVVFHTLEALVIRILLRPFVSAILVILFVFLVSTVSSTAAEAKYTPEQADKFLRAQDWKSAATAYDQLAQADPSNGRFWLRLGVSRIKLHDYKSAVQALDHAEQLGFFPDRTRFELAIAHAGSNEREAAVAWLEKAVAAGFDDSETLDGAEELAALKGTPAFDAIHQRLSKPCENDPAYHWLDFWVGEWEVRDPKGELEGHNQIVKILNSCAIQENWIDVTQHEGKSLFYYETIRKQWKQVWVTDAGNMKEKVLIEHYPDGSTRFQGTLPRKDGSSILDRTTLTPLPDGRVRQVIEQSADNGVTWGSWEGVYTRKSK